jgi:hypothetical protein
MIEFPIDIGHFCIDYHLFIYYLENLNIELLFPSHFHICYNF